LRLRSFHFHRQQQQNRHGAQTESGNGNDHVRTREVLEANRELLNKLEVRVWTIIETTICLTVCFIPLLEWFGTSPLIRLMSPSVIQMVFRNL
jgi:hypothetical protein